MKLGLGTVQFGLDYGITNRQGQTPLPEAARIMDLADQEGIEIIDTAALYGESEEVLGKCLKAWHNFKIVTKTPKFAGKPITHNDARLLEDTFAQSLAKMGLPSLYGLLIHHSEDLLAPNGEILMESLLKIKQQGLVKKIGASVYTGQQIDTLLDKYNTIDIIQLPVNVFDQRLLQSGHLSKLKLANIEIHARSVFLQGLLLIPPSELPDYFAPIKSHIVHYHKTLQSYGLSPLQGALGFVLNLEQVDVVLCGVNNSRQLQDICGVAKKKLMIDNFKQFAVQDECMLNPSLWKVL